MAGMTQIPLIYESQWQDQQSWEEQREQQVRVINTIGPKEVAYDLGVNASQLAHAMSERSRHAMQARWNPYLVRRDPDPSGGLARALVAPGGWVLSRPELLTPEQQLVRLLDVLGRQPEYIRDQLLKEAGLKR